MTILRSLRSENRTSVEDPRLPLTSTALVDWLTAGERTKSGVSVDERKALTISSYWRSVNLIAGTCASLPLASYRAGTFEPVPSRILTSLHPSMTNFEVLEYLFASALTWGNGYALKNRTPAGQMSYLTPLNPEWVKVGKVKLDPKLATYMPSGKIFELHVPGHDPVPLTEVEIFHVPGFGYDGVCGVGPVQLAKQGLGLSLAAEEYGARFFGSGSLMSGILQTDQRLDQEQAEGLKRRWMDKVGGIGRAHEVAILDSGAKFQPISINPSDAQFLESRRFQIQEVARWFGVPPHMLGEVEKTTSWGTGIEQQSLGFVVYTLRPWLTRFEQRFTKEILLDPSVYCSFDATELLRGDSASRISYYGGLHQMGALNVDEIRAGERLPPLPDGAGQTYVQALNMGAIGGTNEPQTDATAIDNGQGTDSTNSD